MNKFTMEKATHVLCGKNYEESHVQEARELYEIPVVNEQWILISVRLNKLAPTKPYFPSTAGKLFHNFVFTMTQIELQDRLKLYAMITLHGGSVQKDLDNRVTHLLSGGSQSVALKVAGLTKMIIVTPDWVVDCLKSKKLIESDLYHPNLLVQPPKQPSKVTLTSSEMKPSTAVRGQLPQNVRPTRPMVVQMQHTPQQINEIIQSQIQQQQMQEQAKQRAAAAAQAATNIQQETQVEPPPTPPQVLVQKQPQQSVQQNVMPPTQSNTILLQKQPQPQPQPAQIQQQPPQVPQSPTQQTMMRMQMQNQPPPQQVIQNLPQTTMTMQPQQMMTQNQQSMVMQQSNQQQQDKQQFIMKQVQSQSQQPQQYQNQSQQQFIMKQVQSQQPQNQPQQQPQTPTGQGYIQIIQQGKQIIQIQHPDGGQMHQKNFMQNQPQIQQQVQAMQQQNPPNVAIQQGNQMPLQQNQPQQVPSSPIQQQPPRQNIVIINQLQNPQNNQMSMQQQRFQSPQQFQKTQIGNQQIIQQKIIDHQNPSQQSNEGIQNVVHIQQSQNQQQQPLTQAQAVLQIAQQLQSTETQPQQFQQIPQSPTQPSMQNQPQTVVQQHIITTNQPGQPVQQFIRTSGPRIFLDSQSSIQFQQMNQAQRQEYLEQLHNKQQQQQRGVMFQQQRPTAPNTPIPNQRAQHHIVIRSQIPPGLTPQQQLQWLQNQRRQILIRQPLNPQGQQGQPQQSMQIQVDPNASPQQQQLQRQQQFQRLQQVQKMPQTPVSPRGPGFIQGPPENVNMIEQQQIVTQDGVSSSKTKTALANMLSNRLCGNNGNSVPIVDQTEPSAAGTLRMMTAQHNAALNVQGMPSGVVRNPQELIVLQQQQQQQIQQQMVPGQAIVQAQHQIQQRRTLGNITNATGAVPSSPIIVSNQMPPGAQVIMPQSPSTSIKSQAPFSPGRAQPPQIVNRPQFYGHNPNLKLPIELFLLGCHFLIVEYDETNPEDLPDWKNSIKHHGGEIESCYNLKVTHVLCRTQKHGIVMQAIRDNKRCVTAYWLNDIILKKQVIPPWQGEIYFLCN